MVRQRRHPKSGGPRTLHGRRTRLAVHHHRRHTPGHDHHVHTRGRLPRQFRHRSRTQRHILRRSGGGGRSTRTNRRTELHRGLLPLREAPRRIRAAGELALCAVARLPPSTLLQQRQHDGLLLRVPPPPGLLAESAGTRQIRQLSGGPEEGGRGVRLQQEQHGGAQVGLQQRLHSRVRRQGRAGERRHRHTRGRHVQPRDRDRHRGVLRRGEECHGVHHEGRPGQLPPAHQLRMSDQSLLPLRQVRILGRDLSRHLLQNDGHTQDSRECQHGHGLFQNAVLSRHGRYFAGGHGRGAVRQGAGRSQEQPGDGRVQGCILQCAHAGGSGYQGADCGAVQVRDAVGDQEARGYVFGIVGGVGEEELREEYGGASKIAVDFEA
mmetsp:Transcript_37948/g.70139  ORF Transcript_37948/g.70139 Transcript_37948/m.70139 type:complete len:379 (+) Transcript_37948:289-1425(+)